MSAQDNTRRQFVRAAGAMAGSVALAPLAFAQQKKASGKPKAEKDEEISPAEDLMREHGVLRRILLIYEHVGQQMAARQNFDRQSLAQAADIVRRFVEDYHEKLEEEYLFPRFEKAGKLTDLVIALKQQHEVGRAHTKLILQFASSAPTHGAKPPLDRIHAFIRMYRPHAAREDTVLFPAFRKLLSEKEYDELGDQFEKREDQLFGENGFEKVVAQVADIEKKLGIYGLNQFTQSG